MHTPDRGNRIDRLVLIIFVLGSLLRLSAATLNIKSNDDHHSVIRILMEERRIPDRDDCWECFQPKLYHLSVAALSTLLAVTEHSIQEKLAQLLSALAGIGTLIVLHRFLKALPVSESVKRLVFAAFALNPKLVGISAQATNDAFVILGGSATLFFFHRFYERQSSLWPGTLALIATCLCKGNGLILFPVVCTPLVARYIFQPTNRRGALKDGLTVAFAFCLVVPFVGPYAHNYIEYGSPFVINVDRAPTPAFFEETVTSRSGITSIAEGYLTFRLVDLLRHPVLSFEATGYPTSRKSLWSQVYARFNSVHYDHWPRPWRSESGIIQNLTRVALVLALVPLIATGAGFLVTVRETFRLFSDPRLLHIAAATAYVLFLVGYTLQYRDFSTMKAIFIMPATPSLAFFTAAGVRLAEILFPPGSFPHRMFQGSIVILTMVYTAESLALVHRLWGYLEI